MIVVFEGIDRVSKTTRVNDIYDILNKRGFNVGTQSFPTHGGITTASGFLQDMSKTMMKWINSPYYDKDECILLVDRYAYSTMAYQNNLELKIPLTIPKPDLGIFFNISPQHSYGREKSYDIFDMNKVYNNYKTIVNECIFEPKNRWLTITKDTTNEFIINHILRVKTLKDNQIKLG